MNACKSSIVAMVVLMAMSAAAFGQSADQTVQAALRGVGAGNPHAAWVALPESYQQDITSLAHAAVGDVDPVVWDRAFAVAAKLVNVLQTKKQWVIESPIVVAAGLSSERVEPAYDNAVEIFALVVRSELATSKSAAQLDVGRFTQTTGSALLSRAMTLHELLGYGPSLPARLKDATVTLVSEQQSAATLKLEAPGESPRTETFVQVEGKWVPRSLADNWSGHVANVHAHFAATPHPDTQQLLAQLDAIDQQIAVLAATDDREAFNSSLGATQLLIMSLLYQNGLMPQQVIQTVSQF